MLVTALTTTNCPKCEQAKEILKDYPVKWIDVFVDDYWREEVKNLTDTVPYFIVGVNGGGIVYIRSVMKVKQMLDEDKKMSKNVRIGSCGELLYREGVTTPHVIGKCDCSDEKYGLPLYLLGEEKCPKCDKILEQVEWKNEG